MPGENASDRPQGSHQFGAQTGGNRMDNRFFFAGYFSVFGVLEVGENGIFPIIPMIIMIPT